MQVFDGGQGAINRGDLVEFVGELDQFGGQAEVTIADKVGNIGFTVLGGGVTTLTLRVDGDTNIPGAATPTRPFDIIGIATQFDTFPPLDGGYQITPRERNDFLSQEVNLPELLINEIHADPANGNPGDANGDGSRSASADEFVELVNPGFTPLDISGWTLSDGVGVKHTFPSATVIPAREAVVIFGGGTPSGAFGNAAANGLVFTASSGSLSLNNAGDTVAVADGSGALVQSVTCGGEGGNNQSLNRDPDATNTPFRQHSQILASGGALYSPGTRVDGVAFTVPAGAVVLTEVLYEPTGAANGHEVDDAPGGASIERVDLAGAWQIQASPTPNASPL